MSPARLAIAGVGLVGKRHAEIAAELGHLAAIADPSPTAPAIAAALDVPHYPDLPALLAAERPDGVVVATPNQRHEADGMACIEAGVPALIEKPITSDVAAGTRLVSAARDAGIPLLVGHHRRYNPLITAAKEAIANGRLGRIVAVNALCWFYKPDPYFDVAWRREPGAGPVLINLIHDIDLLQHLCGRVVSVQASESTAARRFAVEDTAAVVLQFETGALGTMSVSDTVVSPWSWELTAAENPAYPASGGYAYTVGGTNSSLSIPDLRIWRNPGERSWTAPIESEILAFEPADPLVRQVEHFAAVCQNQAEPLVTGEDGLSAVAVIAAIKAAAASGRAVPVMRSD